jgi:glycosyltransferase involved in cell wall biosynthesis
LNKPTLHLIGLFHTKVTQEFSHCAFTGKVLRFSKMLKAQGYDVIEYSNYGSESEACEHVQILDESEFESLYGSRRKSEFYGDVAVVGSEGHQLFESKLIPRLQSRLKPKDIICHPFGHAHSRLLEIFPNHQHVETGIGYPTTMSDAFHIYESYAWMHVHQGKENRGGKNYEWVIPNYFDVDDWEASYEPGSYLAFLGRITSLKGLDTIYEIAQRSPWPIILHGQGDPTPWTHPNIHYGGPISGKKRSEFLKNARAALMPTVFTEPFGGSGVEAMLCGTPLISVDYGAFTETVIDGVTGFRCRTLQDWLDAVDKADSLDRKVISETAREKYSLEACGDKYNRVFTDLTNLHEQGWYTLRSNS